MSKSPFFSAKISPRFKKFLIIFGFISFGFLVLFVMFTWYMCSDYSSADEEYVRKISEESASRNVEGVGTIKMDEEMASKYKEDIGKYVEGIRMHLIVTDATFSYMGENPLESGPYIKNLEEDMTRCDFSKYPYSKELIFPEELRGKIDNLEVLTKSLCNTLSESSNQHLIFFELEDMDKMKELYMGIYDMNQEAYDQRVVIDSTCEDIEELILL